MIKMYIDNKEKSEHLENELLTTRTSSKRECELLLEDFETEKGLIEERCYERV